MSAFLEPIHQWKDFWVVNVSSAVGSSQVYNGSLHIFDITKWHEQRFGCRSLMTLEIWPKKATQIKLVMKQVVEYPGEHRISCN